MDYTHFDHPHCVHVTHPSWRIKPLPLHSGHAPSSSVPSGIYFFSALAILFAKHVISPLTFSSCCTTVCMSAPCRSDKEVIRVKASSSALHVALIGESSKPSSSMALYTPFGLPSFKTIPVFTCLSINPFLPANTS